MIKFKIRDKTLKKMFINHMTYAILMDGRIKESYKIVNGYSIKECLIPLQYIRINDRMNTEIYVGDIVKNGLSGVRVVQECKGGFELLGLDQEYKDSHFKLDALNDECMVFGNIYENPEILEEYNKIPKTKYNTDYLFPNKNNV